MSKPTKKTLRHAIRASVPDGKLKEARILVADIEQNKTALGGFTEYDRKNGGKVTKIATPSGDDAFSISVRGHETRHASKHTLHRKKPMTPNEALAAQIIDDVNIETLPIPTGFGSRGITYRRAHLATALKDLRTIVNAARRVKAGTLPDSIPLRNANLTCAVRTLAMSLHYGGDVTNPKLIQTRGKATKNLRKALGKQTVSAIWNVIKLGKSSRTRARAIGMLVSLMEEERPDIDEGEKEEKEGEGELLMPVVEGSAIDGKMTLIDLRPKSAFCAKEKSITRRHAPNGVIINPNRYVNAIASGESHGLFSRRVRQKPGGTVVIDASGSMGVNRKNLAKLLELIPTATVAYYSGNDQAKGDLVVYALEGKRYSGELPPNTLHGGNAVDLPAVKWLLSMPKPHTLVSDLQFCGGALGSEMIAHALVERALKRGDLTVHRSLDEAYEAFGGKGRLE